VGGAKEHEIRSRFLGVQAMGATSSSSSHSSHCRQVAVLLL